MALFLRSIGKDVRLLNEDPCPKWLKFMPKTSLAIPFPFLVREPVQSRRTLTPSRPLAEAG